MTDIEALRELERLATRGPWSSYSVKGHCIDNVVSDHPDLKDGDGSRFVAAAESIKNCMADAAFIAAARNALPALLDEVERLRAEIDRHVRERKLIQQQTDNLIAENNALREAHREIVSADGDRDLKDHELTEWGRGSYATSRRLAQISRRALGDT